MEYYWIILIMIVVFGLILILANFADSCCRCCNPRIGFRCPQCNEFIKHACSKNLGIESEDGWYTITVSERDIIDGELRWVERPNGTNINCLNMTDDPITSYICPHCHRYINHVHNKTWRATQPPSYDSVQNQTPNQPVNQTYQNNIVQQTQNTVMAEPQNMIVNETLQGNLNRVVDRTQNRFVPSVHAMNDQTVSDNMNVNISEIETDYRNITGVNTGCRCHMDTHINMEGSQRINTPATPDLPQSLNVDLLRFGATIDRPPSTIDHNKRTYVEDPPSYSSVMSGAYQTFTNVDKNQINTVAYDNEGFTVAELNAAES